ncbi:LPXTG cell wall anchor domain-containing protein [Agromyces sp. ISL-38]|uniref:LPXTG cell wall anchor domain-containing protein n=1 Tax=Agromyces sp. ISL-38 TaxID=2819107 RepID=UPI001BE6741C|nr:LPXTG cell wall anchor domain-containing protein [Agromyces sp. ISL-38]MBT2500760.1 LPXTG cell wall anchor domain-containing protein [Agromyces sp. ISL-38]MBT2516646.1 LPXTG cell wall anchor domain-containing protein [Streptomyces sp. ISL-90]
MSKRRRGIAAMIAATLVVFAAIGTAAPAAAAAAGPAALAATGADVMPWLIAGGVALLAGLAAVLVGVVRRRRS